MSYKRPAKGNTLNGWITDFMNFHRLWPHIMEADNIDTFIIWFSKEHSIDPHSTFMYLKHYKDRIPDEYIRFAQQYYRRAI